VPFSVELDKHVLILSDLFHKNSFFAGARLYENSGFVDARILNDSPDVCMKTRRALFDILVALN
jgi:hypothetical protein